MHDQSSGVLDVGWGLMSGGAPIYDDLYDHPPVYSPARLALLFFFLACLRARAVKGAKAQCHRSASLTRVPG